ncbi:MurR/RpiR family transcriptional regulator [Brevibacillus sp. B_LB10_24]|uniref:MurR/RpiR family transcriptional regulator n=1 Tax=Brevibacillus sp. B_LB10_24 TaxID=3380645 RepID=UPI0038BA5749
MRGPNVTVFSKIQNNLENLTQAEKKVAEFILENAEIIPNMTTKDLSLKTGASEASVVRFCKSIGVGSFRSLKMSLVRDLTAVEMNVNDLSIIQKNDTSYDLFTKVTYVNKIAIEDTTSTLDKKELERAVHALLNAKKLLFCGVGGSSVTAMDACHKFTRIGFTSLMSPDFHMMLALVSNLEENDVVVAISTSGKTTDILEVVELSKKRKATVIAITQIDKTPLYKAADIKLCIPNVEQDYRLGNMASRIAQLNIVDALYLIICNKLGTSVIEKINTARREALRLRR